MAKRLFLHCGRISLGKHIGVASTTCAMVRSLNFFFAVSKKRISQSLACLYYKANSVHQKGEVLFARVTVRMRRKGLHRLVLYLCYDVFCFSCRLHQALIERDFFRRSEACASSLFSISGEISHSFKACFALTNRVFWFYSFFAITWSFFECFAVPLNCILQREK